MSARVAGPIVLAALVLCACGGPANAPGDAATDAPTPAETLSLSFGPDRLAVGDERTVCVVLDLGNDVPRQARAIRAALPTGSHHMIVYRTSEPLRATPFPCFSFSSGDAIVGVQTRAAELVYPDEAALALDAHQHIRLEVHEVNYADGPIEVTAAVAFELLPRDAEPRAPVEYLFTGNTALTLPAHATTTVTSFHPVPDGARIMGVASHTHALGVHASIHRATSEAAYTQLLHESTDWASPPFDTFHPGLMLGAGEGLRLECTFDNTTDRTVSFGLDFADEMCFLGAYYY